ncbi:MAG: hypothetical protein A4E61_00394 [Syntrophorhabdus sp. PtaB.Bin184]|nr:MAG: hypothetical protein A4E61_00394 [Syntrophorhabdus sp. PtaB.Bin184]
MKGKYCPLLCEVCPVKRHKWKVYSRPRHKMELKKNVREEEVKPPFIFEMKEAA